MMRQEHNQQTLQREILFKKGCLGYGIVFMLFLYSSISKQKIKRACLLLTVVTVLLLKLWFIRETPLSLIFLQTFFTKESCS